jgi:hypothetical protein
VSTLNFPNSPSVGQIYSFGKRAWQWNGRAWEAYQSVLADPGGGGGAELTREVINYTTAILQKNQAEDFVIRAGKVFHLLSFFSSSPGWVRIYGTEEARTGDIRTSPGGNVPSAGNEYYAELATVSLNQTIRLSPSAIIQSDEDGDAFVRIVNLGDNPISLDINFVVLTLET